MNPVHLPFPIQRNDAIQAHGENAQVREKADDTAHDQHVHENIMRTVKPDLVFFVRIKIGVEVLVERKNEVFGADAEQRILFHASQCRLPRYQTRLRGRVIERKPGEPVEKINPYLLSHAWRVKAVDIVILFLGNFLRLFKQRPVRKEPPGKKRNQNKKRKSGNLDIFFRTYEYKQERKPYERAAKRHQRAARGGG